MPDMTKLNRRGFLKLSGGGGVAAAATLVPFTSANAQTAPADPSQTKLNYPNKAVTAAQKLTVDAPQPFSYPDERSPCTAVKLRSEEHTSELQSLMRSSNAGFCLKNK